MGEERLRWHRGREWPPGHATRIVDGLCPSAGQPAARRFEAPTSSRRPYRQSQEGREPRSRKLICGMSVRKTGELVPEGAYRGRAHTTGHGQTLPAGRDRRGSPVRRQRAQEGQPGRHCGLTPVPERVRDLALRTAPRGGHEGRLCASHYERSPARSADLGIREIE